MEQQPVVAVQGHRIPALGFGTWQLNGQTCREAVAHALELGYRHIDTAQGYENEEEVGEALALSGVPRDEVWLTTKLWVDDLDEAGVRREALTSFARLGVERIDLLLVHWPPQRVRLEPSLRALRRLQEEGRIRALGVSNYPPPLLRRALEAAPVVCDQVEYHPYLPQDALLEAARAADVLVTAYCPLARGRVLDDPVLQEIGARHGKTAGQVALRWLLQQDGVAVVPKAASAQHREENLGALSFELTEEEMARVRGLARGERLIDPDFAPEW